MNELQVFSNAEFGDLGILTIDGKEYFPATTCARILGYTNPHKAIIDHCKRDGVTKREGVSRTTNQHGVTTEQKVSINYITEGNLYRLITHSKLPAAERFESWIFDEVVPTIRKTGSYTTHAATDALPLDKVMEIVQMTATAIMTEFVKQVTPVITEAVTQAAMQVASQNYVSDMPCCQTQVEPDRPKKKAGSIPLLYRLPEDVRLQLFDMLVTNEYSVQYILDWLQREHNLTVSNNTIYRQRRKCRGLM
jgi:prophage antirepressor-like protein